jgi:hypothetical protein
MKRSAAPRRDMPSTSTAWTILLRKSIDVTLPMRIPFSNEGPSESGNPILNKGEMPQAARPAKRPLRRKFFGEAQHPHRASGRSRFVSARRRST